MDRRRLRRRTVCVTAAYVLSLAALIAGERKAALSENEVAHLLVNDVPAGEVIQIVKLYGMGFEILPDVDTRLREAGATDELMSALKTVVPANRELTSSGADAADSSAQVGSVLLIDSETGDVDIYLDGSLKGRAGSDGLLRLQQLTPGSHRLTVTREGFSRFEAELELKVNETTRHHVAALSRAPADAVPPGAALSAPSTVAANRTPSPSTGLTNIARRAPFAVKDAFHMVGIPALKRNNKFDLTVSDSEMVFSKDGKRLYAIPFERLNRVQVNPTQRHYAKSTYAAVVAFGLPGALMLAKKRNVDAVIVDYQNERGGLMQMVLQVPRGVGTPCLGRLAYAGIPVGPPDDNVPPQARN